MVRWKARTARGASPSKRCGRRRITSSRGSPGVADRDAAEKLTNIKLYVSRDKLPPIEDDGTFYHADLVGLAAVAPDGTPLGTVTAILNFGAGDLVEIKPQGGGEPLMVPFTDTAVPEIDIAARRMVVVPLSTTE